MPTIELSLAINLEDYNLPKIERHAGPLFHRWLPNGETDALTLATNNPNASLIVWFTRRGFVASNGYIMFDYDKCEVDPSIMELQAVLDAGPLIGRVTLADVTEDELNALRENIEGSSAYINLGKRVVNLIHPPISRLIQILRVTFGQYWLRTLPSWDSRNQSLGSYCTSYLQLMWRPNPETEWQKFHPTKSEAFLTVTVPSDEFWTQYLLREDYFGLSDVHTSGYTPELAGTILARAHKNRVAGALSYAFVEAATALEIAMSSRVSTAYRNSTNIKKALQAYFDLPLRTQLISLASFDGDLSPDELELALSAIDIRNKIVHEGYVPYRTKENHKALEGLFSVITRFLPGPKYKFPQANSGNKLD